MITNYCCYTDNKIDTCYVIVPCVFAFISTYCIGTRARNAIQAAIDDYKTYSCVNFVARTTERDYVRFFRGNG